jgi:hypothetical protein
MISNKFSDRTTHGKIADTYNDWFSDQRNAAYATLGISQPALDAGQAAIEYGKNSVLPLGGQLPEYDSSVGSKVISTGYNVGFNLSPMLIVGGIVIIGAIYYLAKKA